MSNDGRTFVGEIVLGAPTGGARDYFGVDIGAQLDRWWQGYLPTFQAQHPGKDFVGIISDPENNVELDWRAPLAYPLLVLATGPIHKFEGPEGLVKDVGHMLRFPLRTGLERSGQYADRRHLLLPGDSPQEGAGFYRGFWGGGAGLSEGDNWTEFCLIVDRLVELRFDVADPAVRADRDGEPRAKYLGADVGKLWSEDRN